jgi:hypothetical protein
MNRRGRGNGRRRPGARALCLATLLASAAAPLAAQTNLETNSAVRFNFAAPGAANLALGGAFIGLAFDGTAAYTNPAGLTSIVDPEAWLEARHWSYTHVYTDRGRIEGQDPTGTPPDTVTGLQTGEATDSVAGPSFASYVHPVAGWSLALYAHKLLDFEAGFSTQGAYLERIRSQNPLGLGILGERSARLAALRNRMDAEIDSYGIAVARRVGGGVSLGGSLSYSRLRLDSLAERFLPDLFCAPGAPVCPPPLEEARLVNSQTQTGDDGDWSFSAGALWQSPDRTWSAGGVFRRGPAFDLTTRSRSELGRDDPLFFELPDGRGVFHVPDVYGIGLAWRPSDRYTVALDYDRVEYSDLLDDFLDIFHLDALFPGADPELGAFRIDDADEVHLGGEVWIPRGDRAVSVRLGVWYDPDHTLRFEGENAAYRAVFRGGEDEIHWTGGLGVAFRALQLDVAFDYSDRVSILSISAGRRF